MGFTRRDESAAEGVREALRNVGGESEGERPVLTVEQILAWADAHHAAHGDWPEVRLMAGLGPVEVAAGETWKGINFALALGLRGLPGDSSLAELLAEHRDLAPPDLSPRALAGKLWSWEQEHFPVKKPRLRPAGKTRSPGLSIAMILAWADAHHAARGAWPTARSGPVRDAPFPITWSAVRDALRKGRRGLPAGSTLPRLLAEHRGVRNWLAPEPLSIEQITAWADAHRAATGAWPHHTSGTVRHAPFAVTWTAIDMALARGARGLPGRSSLARVLAERCGARNVHTRPALSIDQILAWADAHRAATGEWPVASSGPVQGSGGEHWSAITTYLARGGRGLPGGQTLARLLAEHRGKFYRVRSGPLSIDRVLAWADAYHATHGRWPSSVSGPVEQAPGETWHNIAESLRQGSRGLGVRMTLGALLLERRGPSAHNRRPRLSVDQILQWADRHHETTGRWPADRSGAVAGAPGETWNAIVHALSKGHRGLPKGTTLAGLLEQHRGRPNRSHRPALCPDQILAWADAHRTAHGRWPIIRSGPVSGAPGETWTAINQALKEGLRGLPGGSSLARLLASRRPPGDA